MRLSRFRLEISKYDGSADFDVTDYVVWVAWDVCGLCGKPRGFCSLGLLSITSALRAPHFDLLSTADSLHMDFQCTGLVTAFCLVLLDSLSS